jgi:hypothetical protein
MNGVSGVGEIGVPFTASVRSRERHAWKLPSEIASSQQNAAVLFPLANWRASSFRQVAPFDAADVCLLMKRPRVVEREGDCAGITTQ